MDKLQRPFYMLLGGATLALLSINQRRELEETVRKIEHIELETDKDFFNHFVEGCQFKPLAPGGSMA